MCDERRVPVLRVKIQKEKASEEDFKDESNVTTLILN